MQHLFQKHRACSNGQIPPLFLQKSDIFGVPSRDLESTCDPKTVTFLQIQRGNRDFSGLTVVVKKMVQIILAVLAGLWRAGEHCRTVGWSSGARFAPRHRSPIRAALRWSKRRGDPTWQGAGLPFDKGRAVVPACVRRLMGSGGRAPSTGSGRRGLLGCRITLGRRKRPKGVILDGFGHRLVPQ